MNETWKPVIGFPEYLVSDFGHVKRAVPDKKNHKCRILKPWLNNKGYLMVSVCNEGGQHKKLVHRLVCEAFHGPAPTKYHEVAHGDGVPTNINENNLRWATRSENMADCIIHGTQINGDRHFTATNPEKIARGERHGMSKLTEQDVLSIRSHEKMKGSGRALAKYYGVSPSMICNIRKGKNWTHVNKKDAA